MSWTKVNKPTTSSYTNVNPDGRTQYDQSDILYDDPNIFYDGVNYGSWTKVTKPTSESWTKINKPT